MVEEYLHLVICYLSPFPAVCDAEKQASHPLRLYMSTPSRRVCDYLVFWTRFAPSVGFSSEFWSYLGVLSSTHGIRESAAQTSAFASPGFVEAYLRKNEGECVDGFWRHDSDRPYYRYERYRLDIADPADF